MRNLKPIIQIDKFSGAGQNGILFCDGFYPEVDNQKSVMAEGFYTTNLFTNATSGLTNLATIKSILNLQTINSYSTIYQLYTNGLSIFSNSLDFSSTIKTAQIHIGLDSVINPDLIETQMGNILFPSEKYIGRGVRFKATSGSTTTIIDTTRNFGDLGYTANDKVTNLKTGIEYTITSISTTTNTNDTLNFTASGTNTTGANDECIAWEDDRFGTDLTKQAWQQTQPNWVKQFKQYDDRIFFTNGNYIGVIGGDELTGAYSETTKNGFKKDFKPLLKKHQAIAIGINNAKVLVSASFNGKGVLLLWDGSSDGWNNSVKFDRPITALTEYQSGWVFVSNGAVYYTDGYQVQKLYSINSTKYIGDYSMNPISCNGLVVYEDILYCANTYTDLNLINYGVYSINLNNVNNGFTLIRCKTASRNNGVPYCVYIIDNEIQVGGENFGSRLLYGNSGGQYLDKSLIMSIPLEDTQKINGIGLNLSRYLKDYNNDSANVLSRDITVSIGDGNRGLISKISTKETGLNAGSITLNGTLYKNNEIGDEVYIEEPTYFGERTFITNITDKGNDGETWTISPALSIPSPTQSLNVKLIRVNKLETKTVNYNDLKDEIYFFKPNTSLLTNKLFIEITFKGQTYPMPLNINEINVYGE